MSPRPPIPFSMTKPTPIEISTALSLKKTRSTTRPSVSRREFLRVWFLKSTTTLFIMWQRLTMLSSSQNSTESTLLMPRTTPLITKNIAKPRANTAWQARAVNWPCRIVRPMTEEIIRTILQITFSSLKTSLNSKKATSISIIPIVTANKKQIRTRKGRTRKWKVRGWG